VLYSRATAAPLTLITASSGWCGETFGHAGADQSARLSMRVITDIPQIPRLLSAISRLIEARRNEIRPREKCGG
jgi:hypothetical protein